MGIGFPCGQYVAVPFGASTNRSSNERIFHLCLHFIHCICILVYIHTKSNKHVFHLHIHFFYIYIERERGRERERERERQRGRERERERERRERSRCLLGLPEILAAAHVNTAMICQG